MAEVPRDLVVNEGDFFSVSVPYEMIVAVVGSIEKNKGDAFQKIKGRLPINVGKIKFVYVYDKER